MCRSRLFFRRFAWTAILCLVAIWCAIYLGAGEQAGGQPAPTVTATAPVVPPAAPDSVQGNGVVTWRDNSDNEDGFRVEVVINGETHAFIVGPNVTTFEVPAELLDQCGERRYNVAAFNEAGEALSIGGVIFIAECPGALLEATPTAAPTVLPGTGNPATAGSPFSPFLYGLVGLAALLVAVAWALSRGRQGRP